MIVATTAAEVREVVRGWRAEGLTVGLVPTMGYLHEGHTSLVDRALAECDRVMASVFVNPTQFGPNEDLATYPRDFDHDCAVLEEHGCSMVFHPEVAELYPKGACTFVENLSEAPTRLCGRTRPIHFRGVLTVVAKLFNIVAPDRAYFGQKDAQQLAIVRRMAADLCYDIAVVGCPIVREADGLAKSSRNTYLSPEEREAALVLSRSLVRARELIAAGETDAATVLAAMAELIETEPLARIDYVSAVDPLTMDDVETLAPGTLVAMAVHIGSTRLIDNLVVGED